MREIQLHTARETQRNGISRALPPTIMNSEIPNCRARAPPADRSPIDLGLVNRATLIHSAENNFAIPETTGSFERKPSIKNMVSRQIAGRRSGVHEGKERERVRGEGGWQAAE